MIIVEQVHAKIAEALKQSKLFQTATAKLINVSQQSVSHYVKGAKLSSLDTFANLCVALDACRILCLK